MLVVLCMYNIRNREFNIERVFFVCVSVLNTFLSIVVLVPKWRYHCVLRPPAGCSAMCVWRYCVLRPGVASARLIQCNMCYILDIRLNLLLSIDRKPSIHIPNIHIPIAYNITANLRTIYIWIHEHFSIQPRDQGSSSIFFFCLFFVSVLVERSAFDSKGDVQVLTGRMGIPMLGIKGVEIHPGMKSWIIEPQMYFPWTTQRANIANTHVSAYCR